MSDDVVTVPRYTGPEPPPSGVLAALRCGRRDASCAVAPVWAGTCKMIALEDARTLEEMIAEVRANAPRARAAAAAEQEFWNRVARGEDPKVVLFRRRYRPWHK